MYAVPLEKVFMAANERSTRSRANPLAPPDAWRM